MAALVARFTLTLIIIPVIVFHSPSYILLAQALLVPPHTLITGLLITCATLLVPLEHILRLRTKTVLPVDMTASLVTPPSPTASPAILFMTIES